MSLPSDVPTPASPSTFAEHLLESVLEPIVVLDGDLRIVQANAHMVALAGGEKAALLGRRLGEALGCIRLEEGGECGTTEFCRLCGANVCARNVTGQVTEDRRECRMTVLRNHFPVAIDLEVFSAAVRTEEGPRVIMTLRDITDEKRRGALERVFFHDLLNAAGGVRGMLEVWGTLSPDEIAELLPQARFLVDGLIEEVDAQRALAAAECGELEVEEEELEVEPFLESLLLLYRHHPVAQDRLQRIEQSGGSVRTDPTLLRRVLGNLLKNALEATPPGGCVTLSYAEAPEPMFAVHNPAIMPADVKGQVFQRSFTTKGPGRGLGTWGARLLVERYLGGRISFRSESGMGTVFEIRLPRAASLGAHAA